jgi:hypothetical protein
MPLMEEMRDDTSSEHPFVQVMITPETGILPP